MNKHQQGFFALSPLIVFVIVYLVSSLIAGDFYKVPITVAFTVSAMYGIAVTRGLPLDKRITLFSKGAGKSNLMLMIWIFILAGAFAASAKAMGAIDETVNLSLKLLPDNLLLGGIFLAACFISLSIGTSVGTIVALTPIAAGIAQETHADVAQLVAIVVGGSFFGDNLSFISDTTITATRTQGCKLSDKFKVNSQIVIPAAAVTFMLYILMGVHIQSPQAIPDINWVKVIPYLDELDKDAEAIGAVNVIKLVQTKGKRKLIGYNSDLLGFTQSIEPLLEPFHKKALILGTGGASKAINHGLQQLGLETLFVSRSRHDANTVTYEELTPEIMAEYKVIVNCTPVGMYPQADKCPEIPYECLTPQHLLYDLLYNPDTTLFMKKGSDQGAVVKNGLEMLLLQAFGSWDIWNRQL